MSREIKFRAWVFDPESNTGHMAVQTNSDADTLKGFIKHYGDFPLMQYTGVKTTDGKEIYEADIIKVEIRDRTFKETNTTDIIAVEIEDGICNASPDWIEASAGWGAAEDVDVKVKSITVIGNTYMNPELSR